MFIYNVYVAEGTIFISCWFSCGEELEQCGWFKLDEDGGAPVL